MKKAMILIFMIFMLAGCSTQNEQKQVDTRTIASTSTVINSEQATKTQ